MFIDLYEEFASYFEVIFQHSDTNTTATTLDHPRVQHDLQYKKRIAM